MSGKKITTAEAVNRIIERLTNNPPRFDRIDDGWIEISMGHREYLVGFNKSFAVTESITHENGDVEGEWTDAAKWVEAVLNGQSRNDAGEMV